MTSGGHSAKGDWAVYHGKAKLGRGHQLGSQVRRVKTKAKKVMPG